MPADAAARSLAPLARQLRARPTAQETPAWLDALRQSACAALDGLVLPDERTEAWRYTSLPALADMAMLAPAANGSAADAPDGWAAAIAQSAPEQAALDSALFVDGRILQRSGSTLLAGAAGAAPSVLGTLAPLGDAFVALNAACIDDVLDIDVPADAATSTLLVQHRTSAALTRQAASRVCIRVRRNACLVLIEDIAPASGLHNLVTEIELEDGAQLQHWRASRGGAGTSVARIYVRVGRDATYQGYQQLEGGHRVREELHIELAGDGAQAHLAGVAHLQGRDHGDLALRIEHLASRTTSTSVYRGIAGERGRFVFKGQIHIPEGVHAIDAALTNKNLLLSNDAEVDTRPELTINADDVRCSHGATVGQLDADALFLLRARGIDEAVARGLIMRAFAVAALHALPESPERTLLGERLQAVLGASA